MDSVSQQVITERSKKTDNPFKSEYKRLNKEERNSVKTSFCSRYKLSDSAFRSRLCGTTQYSESELAYLKNLVGSFFSNLAIA